MRSLSAGLTAALALDVTRDLTVLLEVMTDTPIRRANWAVDVTYKGDTYAADTVNFGELSQDTQGQRSASELSLQNVQDSGGSALPWSSYLQTDTLNGTEVRIHVVDISVGEAVSETQWYVSGWRIDREYLRLRVGSPHDALAFATPHQPIASRTCRWDYKVGPCTSESTLTSCPKTLEACRKRFKDGAVLPFGPGTPLYDITEQEVR